MQENPELISLFGFRLSPILTSLNSLLLQEKILHCPLRTIIHFKIKNMNEINRIAMQGEISHLRANILFLLVAYQELLIKNATLEERKRLRVELRQLVGRISQLKDQLTW